MPSLSFARLAAGFAARRGSTRLRFGGPLVAAGQRRKLSSNYEGLSFSLGPNEVCRFLLDEPMVEALRSARVGEYQEEGLGH